MPISNGQLATHVGGDASFVAKLTPGTVLQFSLSGKLGGTINGMPIAGSGHLEYTFQHGASAWVLAPDSVVQGPTLPAGPIVYVPSNASGTAAVTTTGTVVSSAPFDSGKDRYNYKLKGRVASITVAVFEENSCNLAAVNDCSFDCETEFAGNPNCINDCNAWKANGLGC